MDRIVALSSPRGSPSGSCRRLHRRPQGDVMKELKEMIVLNGHLQQRLDAVTTPRRATR